MAFVAYDPGSLASQSRKRLRSLQKYGLPTAQAYQKISENITPQENTLSLQQLQKYAPQMQQLGLKLQGEQQQGGIKNDLAALLGPGRDLVGGADALDRALNPEFYQQREATNKGYLSLLAGQDPNKLSGSELAETERGLNRMNTSRGNINVTDATTTAANAGAFGSALAGKQARFSQALSLFPSLSGASRSPLDAFGIATGRNNTPNPLGVGNVSTGNQSGKGIDQNIQDSYRINQQVRAGAKTGSDAFEGGVGACMGCYIFKEYFGYPDVPQYMRWCRDYENRRNPFIGIGYKKMSFWLVPLMQRYKLIRSLIYYSCVLPIDKYCQFRTGYTTSFRWLKTVEWFWRNLWSSYGKKK